jgi:hypothetical protein
VAATPKVPIFAPAADVNGEIDRLEEFSQTGGSENYSATVYGGTGGTYADQQALMEALTNQATGDRGLPVVWDGATNGFVHAQPRPLNVDRHVMVAQAKMGAPGYAFSGWPRTPSIRGSLYGADIDTEPGDGPWVAHRFDGSSGDNVGIMCSDYSTLYWGWLPTIYAEVKTDSIISSQRWWIGAFSEPQITSGTPWFLTDPGTDDSWAAFRYDTGDSDTTWQCISSDGTAAEQTSSGITVNVNAAYQLAIRRTANTVEFYAKQSTATAQGNWDAPVATHSVRMPATPTFTIPPAAADFGAVGIAGRSLAASTRSLRVKRLVVTHG